MTLIQFGIARRFAQLLAKSPLTLAEMHELAALELQVKAYEKQERNER